MRATTAQITKLTLSNIDAADPVSVIAENISEKQLESAASDCHEKAFNVSYGTKLPWFLQEQAS